MGGQKRPGINCLCMCDHSLGIRLSLEIVSKINTYMSDIFQYHRKCSRLPVDMQSIPGRFSPSMWPGYDATC